MSRRRSLLRAVRAAIVLTLMIPARPASAAGSWSTKFALPTLNGEIRASTVWNGKLVLGGDFTRAGKVGAPYVVAWNGTGYEPLGSGVPSRVLVLGTHGGDLYAYTTVGTGVPRALRKWDGVSWSTIVTFSSGQGLNAICSHLGALYVGGSFTSIGGVTANNVARFDGANWTALGAGTAGPIGGSVAALASFGGALYAGGQFQTADGVATGPVAKWDGSAWSKLGSGVNWTPSGTAVVSGLFADASGLVVGGSWNSINNAPCYGPGLWNGSSWQCMDPYPAQGNGSSFTNVSGSIVGTVHLNTGASGTSLWTGSAWTSLQDSLTAAGTVRVDALGNDLYLMGGYLKNFVGGAAVCWRKYNGVTWSNPDPWEADMHGLGQSTYTLIPYGGKLVASGAFTHYGAGDHLNIGGIAAWDGSSWQPLGTGLSFGGQSSTLYQGDLVVGGYFATAGGVSVKGVGRWNGTSWTAFGPGLSYPESDFPFPKVYDLTPYGTDLVACGEFTQTGGSPVTGIARWDGSAWQPMGSGFDVVTYGDIPYDLLADGPDLYVGGSFTSAGGVPAARIARWDGGAWHAVGSGFADGGLFALTKFENELIAGGTFSVAGGSPANGAARWRNGTWQPLGTNALDVEDFLTRGGALFAAGKFLRDDLSTHVGIARWDGDRWTPIGGSASVATGFVNAYSLASFGDEIFVGGRFDFVDGVPSVNIAAFEDAPLASAPPTGAARVVFSAPRPNPASARVEFSYTLPSAMHVRLAIHDLLGREVAVLADGWQDAGVRNARWDGRLAGGARAAGLYEAVLVTDAGRLARKLVWTH